MDNKNSINFLSGLLVKSFAAVFTHPSYKIFNGSDFTNNEHNINNAGNSAISSQPRSKVSVLSN